MANQSPQHMSGTAPFPISRTTFFRLMRYTRTAWKLLVWLLLCIAIKSLLELAIPWIMGFMLFDGVIAQRDLSRLPLVITVLTAVFVTQKLFAFLQEYLNELTNQEIVHKLRCDFFEHIERLPLAFFDRRKTGDLQSRVTSDVDTADGLLKTLVEDLSSELFMFIGTISFLFAVNWKLTLFILPTLPALALSVFFFKRTIKRCARSVRDLIGDLSSQASETISGIRVVKAFCGEVFEAARFSSTSKELLRARVRIAKLQSIYSSTVDIWVFAGTLIVILVASPRVIEGTFTVGALVAYLSYLNKLYGPAKKLSKINVSIQKILAAGDRIFEVMDVSPEPLIIGETRPEKKYYIVPGRPTDGTISSESGAEVQDSNHSVPVGGSDDLTGEMSQINRGAVRFENVCFAYNDDQLVLKNLDLSVDAGRVVALVGHSGGGKTTIVNLLLRLYRPTSGQILIDDIPLERIPLSILRRQIGIVQQEPFLFTGTIHENIAYADLSVSSEQVTKAAVDAYAHDFIMQLPDGYDTVVGERGSTLSGGQRQRIALARALVRDPRILILDEATAHLDSEAERFVQDTVETAAKDRTVFVIAHRLSSIWRADNIVVVESGEIAQIGKHDDLLASSGIYQRLYSLQGSSNHTVSH